MDRCWGRRNQPILDRWRYNQGSDAVEKDNDVNDDDIGGEVFRLVVQTITHFTAIDSFVTSITWAEENEIDAGDILVLKRLQEKVLKASFKTKTNW